jgi:hypothetical protein
MEFPRLEPPCCPLPPHPALSPGGGEGGQRPGEGVVQGFNARVVSGNSLRQPELGAPTSLPACRGVVPETRRQGCRRSQYGDRFMGPMRDSGIVEAPHNPCCPLPPHPALTPVGERVAEGRVRGWFRGPKRKIQVRGILSLFWGFDMGCIHGAQTGNITSHGRNALKHESDAFTPFVPGSPPRMSAVVETHAHRAGFHVTTTDDEP